MKVVRETRIASASYRTKVPRHESILARARNFNGYNKITFSQSSVISPLSTRWRRSLLKRARVSRRDKLLN